MKKNPEIVISILLDGCKYDYSKCFNFKKYGTNLKFMTKVEEPFGFEGALPAIWAGIHPETSDICNIFGFLKDSPLGNLSAIQKFAQKIKKITVVRFPYISRAINSLLLAFFIKLLVPTQMRRGYIKNSNPLKNVFFLLNPKRGYTSLFDIPFYLLRYFWFYEDKMPYSVGYIKPTLFDLLRQKEKKFAYLQNPVKIFKVDSGFQVNEIYSNVKKIIADKCDFACLTLASLDISGHAFGPNSQNLRGIITKIDEVIYNIWVMLLKSYDKVTIVLHADHGMVEVNNSVNIWQKLKDLSVQIKRDYVVFLDSSMARFWFFNEKAKGEIADMLGELDCGRILTEEDYKRYNIKFKDNKYWDLVWLADPGTLIFPNFFGWYQPVKGMHGYAPENEDNMGIFAVISNKSINFKDVESIKMVDVLPTFCDVMELAIPPTCEGQSIVKK